MRVLRPSYCVLGSASGWRDPQPMAWDQSRMCFTYQLMLGDLCRDSFLILEDGLPEQTLHPSCQDASIHVPHELCGPDANSSGLFWTVGLHHGDQGRAGDRYEIRLLFSKGKAERVEWSRLS
mmetsp:Transcript_48412/g.78645  ORF Transcript_48412/g.78645 Transcript_48412/m.78645 type:complete len:122 (-) Transcript_48412:324-689(-)